MNKKEISKKMRYFSVGHKKTIGIILAIVTALIAVTVIWGKMQTKDQVAPLAIAEQNGDFQANIVYYYGKVCTHCRNVEKFIDDNKIESKISFAKKEVWHDPVNDMEMRERAEGCALDPEKVGVPFLWARGKCYKGEAEVRKFLTQEIGLEK